MTWSELGEADLILVSGLSGNRALLDYQLASKRLSLRGTYEVEHLSTAIGLVAAGVGTAILPLFGDSGGRVPAGAPDRAREARDRPDTGADPSEERDALARGGSVLRCACAEPC